MKTYSIRVSHLFENSLKSIVYHKILYDERSALDFEFWVVEAIHSLKTQPYRGFNYPDWIKAIIYRKHLLLYQIQEPNMVNIVDIIDPRQYKRSKKYY